MPKLIEGPTQIPVPGNKIIDEYIGRLNSGDTQTSIAHMRSPAGWSEPGQRPDFDEYTVVLKGVMRVEHEAGLTEVKAGQAIIARKGEWFATAHPKAPNIWRSAFRHSRRTQFTATLSRYCFS
jgi:mannose-6-phosphate isomerase-like protein (cupin superfamily)